MNKLYVLQVEMTDKTKYTIPPQKTKDKAFDKLLKFVENNPYKVENARMYVFEKSTGGGK